MLDCKCQKDIVANHLRMLVLGKNQNFLLKKKGKSKKKKKEKKKKRIIIKGYFF